MDLERDINTLLNVEAKPMPAPVGEPIVIAYIAMGVARAFDEASEREDIDIGEADLVSCAIVHAALVGSYMQRALDAGAHALYELVEPFGRQFAEEVMPADGVMVSAADAIGIIEAILSDLEA